METIDLKEGKQLSWSRTDWLSKHTDWLTYHEVVLLYGNT